MGTVATPIDVYAMRVDLVNTPEFYVAQGTNFPSDGYAFPQNSARAVYLKIGAEQYGSGNWTVDLRMYSRTPSVVGGVTWTVAMAAITPGDAQSIETKAFATAQTVTATINSTGKGDTSAVLSLANLDSVAAGDDVWIKITRTDVSMVGDAILFRASLSYSDGVSFTNSSSDIVTPSDFPSVGTALQDIPGTTLVIPAAGTYKFSYELNGAHSTATNNVQYAALAVGGTISNFRMRAAVPSTPSQNNYEVVPTNGVATTAVSRSATAGIVLPTTLSGTFSCTAAGTLVARCQTNGGVLTNGLGSFGNIKKI